MFAGSFPGITQTVPLAIFARFSSDFTSALALSSVLVIVSAALLLSVKLLGRSRCSGVGRRERARGQSPRPATRAGAGGRPAGRGPKLRGDRRALGSREVDRAADRRRARRPDPGLVAVGGRTWLDSDRGVDLPPEERACGFMFQEYALFPHLSVWRNVAFGISGRGAGRRARALRLLESFGVGELAEASPGSISGGERQRVALARALARSRCSAAGRALSALDTRTRAHAGRELVAALRGAGVPAIVVTHDFAEAALLADEICVMDRGQIVQRGTAAELSARPASAFVADFAGSVVLNGTARRQRQGLTEVELDGGGQVRSTDAVEGPVAVSVFPWEIGLEPAGAEPHGSALNWLAAEVVSVTEVGNRVRVGLAAPQPLVAEVTAQSTRSLGLGPGVRVTASWKATATRLVARRALAADLAHRPRRLAEPRLVDPMLQLLAPHGVPDDLLQRVVARAGAQRLPQIGLVDREQAGPQLAVGGDADAVAIRAEGLGDRVDEADLAAPTKRKTLAVACGSRGSLELMHGLDDLPDLPAGEHRVGPPIPVGVERHELDEAHLIIAGSGQLAKRSTSSSVKSRMAIALTLIGRTSGKAAIASRPRITCGSASRRVILKKASRASESIETLNRSTPARTRPRRRVPAGSRWW